MRTPTALDRTRTEHIARVDGVRWPRVPSDDDTFVILSISDGLTAKGSAKASDFIPGILYRFFGRWESSPRFGDAFNFETFTIHNLCGEAGVVAYLNNQCPGDLTPKKAQDLFRRYGSTVVELLRTDPQSIAEDGILDAEKARRCSDILKYNKDFESTRMELFGLLKGKGFHRVINETAIRKWKIKAPEIIRRDPFKLMILGCGAGFKRCDKLWTELGLPKDRLKRQLYAAMEVIRQDRTGSTWLSKREAEMCCQRGIGPGAKPKKALELGIRARRLVMRVDEKGQEWITILQRDIAERKIATAIARLRKCKKNLWPTTLAAEGETRPTDHQLAGLHAATRSPVGIFMGGPGSGKTFTLSFLLRELLKTVDQSSIAVCAPTGKAAVRAGQSLQRLDIDIRATTIHQLLQFGSGPDGFSHHEDRPLPYEFIIVDESPMIGTPLMASLLSACGNGTHILFVGDLWQLPPVDHGAPVRDMIDAGISYGLLSEIQRNQGAIVEACKSIREGTSVRWSERIDLEKGENLKFVECDPADIAEIIEQILLRGIKDFHRIWDIQVIVGLNDKGVCSRVQMNEQLQGLLNPAYVENKLMKYRTNDKVICLKNTLFRRFTEKRMLDEVEALNPENYIESPTTQPRIYVANGEIGRVLASSPEAFVVAFGEREKLVKFKTKKRQEKAPESNEEDTEEEISLAYAATCHKMQGSESPVIIVVCDSAAASVATLEWWNTALSRASKLCIVVGSKAVFERQSTRPTTVHRKTFLAEKIREAISNGEASKEEVECVLSDDLG